MLFLDERVHHGRERIAQKDRDDGWRCLVGAKAMVVSGRGDACAQQVGMLVHGRDEAGKKYQELQVILGIVTRLKEVLAVCAE